MADYGIQQVEFTDRSIEKLVRGITGSSSGNSRPSFSSSSSSSSSSSAGFDTLIPKTGILGTVADAMTSVINKASKDIEQWRFTNSNFGMAMNNDAGQLNASVTKTRMTFNEFIDSVEYGKIGFASIGGTMTESAKVFLKVSTDLSDVNGDELRRMGYEQGEYNKLLAITMSSSRNLDLQKKEDQIIARESTVALASEMDKMAKLTGISRKEQEDNMLAVQNDMRVQAKFREMDKQGLDTKELRQQYAKATAMGDGARESMQQIITGGQMSQKAIYYNMQTGAELHSAQSAATRQMMSASAEERAAGKRNSIIAQETAKAKLLSDTSLNNIMMTQNNTEYVEMLAENQRGAIKGQGEATIKVARENGISLNEAVIKRYDNIEKDQQGFNIEGQKAPGTEKTEFDLKLGTTMLDFNKKLGETQESLNNAWGIETEKLALLKNLNDMRTMDGKAFADNIAGMGDAIDGFNKSFSNGSATEDLIKNIQNLFEAAGETAIKGVAKGIEMGTNRMGADITPTPAVTGTLINPPGYANKKQGRADGSKEATGQWFENFGSGTDMTLHGMEAVVPKDKIPQFIADMQQQMMGKKSPNDAFTQLENISKSNLTKLESSEMYKRNNSAPPVTPAPAETKPQSIETGTVTIKDLNDQLTKLNTIMVKLVTNTNEMVDIENNIYRATKRTSRDLNAR